MGSWSIDCGVTSGHSQSFKQGKSLQSFSEGLQPHARIQNVLPCPTRLPGDDAGRALSPMPRFHVALVGALLLLVLRVRADLSGILSVGQSPDARVLLARLAVADASALAQLYSRCRRGRSGDCVRPPRTVMNA